MTGISTGALIAPFAFLGPTYDGELKALYTSTSAKDILTTRWYLAALTNDAMADTQPLRGVLRKHLDQALLDAIAAEYAKGRELWIATTNLDGRVRYIWTMTRIAATRHPRAHLFHSLMIASAAIPGAFPPVMIDVDAGGRRYQEMHVDGGAGPRSSSTHRAGLQGAGRGKRGRAAAHALRHREQPVRSRLGPGRTPDPEHRGVRHLHVASFYSLLRPNVGYELRLVAPLARWPC